MSAACINNSASIGDGLAIASMVDEAAQRRTVGYSGELVSLEISDHLDDTFVLTLPGSDDTAEMSVEISVAEAREIIAGLAALL